MTRLRRTAPRPRKTRSVRPSWRCAQATRVGSMVRGNSARRSWQATERASGRRRASRVMRRARSRRRGSQAATSTRRGPPLRVGLALQSQAMSSGGKGTCRSSSKRIICPMSTVSERGSSRILTTARERSRPRRSRRRLYPRVSSSAAMRAPVFSSASKVRHSTGPRPDTTARVAARSSRRRPARSFMARPPATRARWP